MSNIYDIAIIGGGAAGIQALNRSVLNNDKTILFTGTPKDKKRSRGMWVKKVENMPGLLDKKLAISQTGKEQIQFLKSSPLAHKMTIAEKIGVTSIKKDDNLFIIQGSDNQTYKARFIILATGIMDIQPVINDSIEPIFPFANNQVVDYCIRCDGHMTYGKKIAIIGNSQTAFQIGILLKERYELKDISVILHENSEKVEIEEPFKSLVQKYNIKRFDSKITKVLGPKNGKELEGFELANGDAVEATFAFISLGTIVYNQLAKELGANIDNRGYVITNENGESSIKGVFIAGDLRANAKKQIYTAWDHAVDAADEINRQLRLKRRSGSISR